MNFAIKVLLNLVANNKLVKMNKKIAIFHQFLDNIGGAEIVTLTLARELNADIYTTNINEEAIKKMGFESILNKIHSIGKIPIKAPFRHQSAFYKFRKLNLKNKYDFYIISGDWAMSGAVNNKPNLWYIHSPLNELWDFKDFVRRYLLNWWKRPIFDLWVKINRKLTLKYARHVNIWICNSKTTKNRIKKYYNKNAKIINPPIETKKYQYKKPKNYWLSVNRYVKHKRIEMQLKAFEQLKNENLVIVASYEKKASQFEEYKKQIDLLKQKHNIKNVKILNFVSSNELIEFYSKCKGFITTARDEDFGMTPLEAMASGKPVIAANEGGYKETITNKTGILIDNIDEQKLAKQIKILSKQIKKNPEKFKEQCQKQAKKFDTKEFIKKIKNSIKNFKTEQIKTQKI